MQQQPENDFVYFLTILEAAGKIELYTKEFHNASDFFQANNQLNFNASLLLIATIGEQINKISEPAKIKHSQILWKEIRDTRNRIVHDYTGIDFDITYDIVSKEIPLLKKQIQELVKSEIQNGVFSIEELGIAKNNSLWYGHIDFAAIEP